MDRDGGGPEWFLLGCIMFAVIVVTAEKCVQWARGGW